MPVGVALPVTASVGDGAEPATAPDGAVPATTPAATLAVFTFPVFPLREAMRAFFVAARLLIKDFFCIFVLSLRQIFWFILVLCKSTPRAKVAVRLRCDATPLFSPTRGVGCGSQSHVITNEGQNLNHAGLIFDRKHFFVDAEGLTECEVVFGAKCRRMKARDIARNEENDPGRCTVKV